jgi:hypothetical protein
MKTTIRPLSILLLAAIALTMMTSCATPIKNSTSANLMDKQSLYEVIGHLYRWYLDEVDVRNSTKVGNETIWIRQVEPELDPGDKSLFAELVLPVIGVSVMLKKADYTIEKIDVAVTSDRFKIIRVSRIQTPEDLTDLYTPIALSGTELREYLFNKRGTVAFPDDALVKRLRKAAREAVDEHLKASGKKIPKGTRTIHCAPLSPVANELWVFWETGRMLMRFASDLDLSNPHVWQHETLSGKIYDIDEQVVVSLQEAPASNAYLTRDQVGRALYNCVVLGRKYELPAP